MGFYFTGDKGGLLFDKDTTISLTAPTSGEMAGLLMAEQTTVSARSTRPSSPMPSISA